MKKKLEAELISIAHRILKLKNRSDLDQLQAETLKLYEKLSVLKFVEDNFADVKPTIGYASAEGKLEEIYGIEETPEVHANEVEAKEEKAKEEKKSPPATKGGDEEAKPQGDADPEQKVEEYQASEEEKEHTEEGTDESAKIPKGDDKEPVTEDEPETDEKPEPVGEPTTEEKPEEIKEPEVKSPLTPEGEIEEPVKEGKKEEEKAPEEPGHKVDVVKPEAEVKAMEEGAAAVFEKEDASTIKEEEKAADAEVVTIEPDASAKTEDSGLAFDFAFERAAAPETPQKQKEISFEDFHDYKEPEFVKKDEPKQKQEEKKEEEKPADDWRNWEPSKPATEEKPKEEEPKQPEPVAEEKPADDWRNWEPSKPAEEEPKQPEPVAEAKPAAPRALNDSFGKTITLGLNDRIAFEKHLFGGSSEDLNRVVSQINTQNSFSEAKAFIEDLVKPDYNNWKGKEEYEERFMALVEKKFE